MNTRLGLLGFALLAACGSSSTTSGGTTTPTGNTGGAAASGPVYASLFQPDKVWTFQVVTMHGHWDDQDPAADANGNVRSESTGTGTCKVDQLIDVAGGQAASILCEWTGTDGNGTTDPLTGVWAHDARGLFKLEAMPAVGAAIDGGSLVLAAQPVAGIEDISAQVGEEGAASRSIEQRGDAWCWSESFAMGDEAWQSVCFGPAGPTEGEFGWAGGSEHNTKFTLVK